jgi:DNA-binding transcriptional ArsR family regulator
MADKERLTEQIKFLIEILRLAWLSLLAATSGTVGLLLGELNNRRVAFAAVGTVIVASFLVYIGHLLRRIRITIDKLSEV